MSGLHGAALSVGKAPKNRVSNKRVIYAILIIKLSFSRLKRIFVTKSRPRDKRVVIANASLVSRFVLM